MNEFGKIIEERRKQLGLTLEEVGQAVGVTKSTVKKWETGYISNMKRDRISALAKVLQISPVVLIKADAQEPEISEAKAKVIKLVEKMSDEDCEAVLRLLSREQK